MRKIIISLLVGTLVSLSLILNPIGVGGDGICLANPLNDNAYGTLCTTTGASITEMELAELLDQYIPTTNSQSRLVVLTQCYGGDAMESLKGKAETTVLSATSAGQEAVYGGYDNDAASALKPGSNRTSDDVHNAGTNGKDPTETPQKDGPGASLEPTSPGGTIKSRHVLVYAGKPDGKPGRDNDQRDTIKNNFQGQQNTTVTTVGGAGGGGWDYPGSMDGLKDALKDISQKMNDDEQFILFVTDHGDLHHTPALNVVLPEQYNEIYIYLPDPVYDRIIWEPDNQADFSFITYDTIGLYIEGIVVNGHEYYDPPEFYEIDINDDQIIDYYKYIYPLNEDHLLRGENQIGFFCYNTTQQEAIMSIGTGDIPKKDQTGTPEDITLELPEGWSMISLPVIPNDATLSSLFPGAAVVYGYEKGSGYVRVNPDENLEVGKGYWILLNSPRSYVLTGQHIFEVIQTVNENKWAMIGGCTGPAKASMDNGTIEVIYRYVQGTGYERVLESESLERGKGYWILMSNIVEEDTLHILGM